MTESCQVIRTSIGQVFAIVLDEGRTNIQGESRASTKGSYDDEEAAHDCMVLGAKSVVVFDQRYAPKSPNYGVTVGNVTLLGNSSAPGFLTVFFDKELPVKGRVISMDDYLNWAVKSWINNCRGCERNATRHPTCHVN